MAHYAIINPTTMLVTAVFIGKDETDGGADWEQYYALEGTICRHTSYNTHGGIHQHGGIPFRYNYAGIGYTYDPTRDAFIPPKPYPSWALNETTCLWEPPVPYPTDGEMYDWDETTETWVAQ